MSVSLGATTQAEKKRILVVDDRASTTHLLKLYLERSDDYEVREENEPKAAFVAAEEFRPHMILLDVMMPSMDGGDLAARFQASPEFAAVPIVFLTSAVTREEVEIAHGWIGGRSFLAKPVVLPELLACLELHLG